MKKIRFVHGFYMMIALAVGVVSCNKDDSALLSVSSPEGTDFPAEGGSKAIEVNSDGGWSLSIDMGGDNQRWLLANISSGKGSQKVYLTALNNVTTDTRNATLTFTSAEDAGVTKQLSFTQSGVIPLLTVSPENVIFSALSGNQATLKIESNTEWTVQSDQEWLKISKNLGKGSDTVVLSCDENEGNARNATITVSVNGFSLARQVQVSQKGIDEVIYKEPYTAWGASMSDVLSHTQDYSILVQEANALALNGKYKEQKTGYIFDFGRLVQAVPVIDCSVTNTSELSENLKGIGYVQGNNTLNSFPTFVSGDGKNYVVIESNTSSDAYFVRYRNNECPFTTPYVNWSAPLETVKTAFGNRGYNLYEESVVTGGYVLTYNGMYVEEVTIYYFDNTQKLVYYRLFFDTAATTVAKLCSFLSSMYAYAFVTEAADKSGFLYQSIDGKTKVIAQNPNNDTPYICLWFISASYWSLLNSPTRGIENESVIGKSIHQATMLYQKKQ